MPGMRRRREWGGISQKVHFNCKRSIRPRDAMYSIVPIVKIGSLYTYDFAKREDLINKSINRAAGNVWR